MPLTSKSLPEYWDTYKPHNGEGEPPPPTVDSFEWTQHPGHGPGDGFLGQPAPPSNWARPKERRPSTSPARESR